MTEPSAEVVAAPAVAAPGRRRAGAPGRALSATTEWTTTREEALECAGCGAPFVLCYKYRFVEGLRAAVVRCPAAGCHKRREYYLPVNAYDVTVTPAALPPRL